MSEGHPAGRGFGSSANNPQRLQEEEMMEIRKILVIQTAFLGDVVLTIPLLNALRRNFPQAHIAVLVIPQTREIIEELPFVDEIIVFDKKGSQKSLGAFWQLIRKIRTENFDVAVLPHRSFKSALLAYASRIPLRIGFNASQGAFLLTHIVKYQYEMNVHEINRNLDLLSVLVNAQKQETTFGIAVARETEDEVEKLLSQHNVKETDLLIAINPGSVWPTKRFPAEKYAAVADQLIRTLGAKIIIVGSAADRETGARMEQSMKEPVINLVGMTTIKQITALLKRCKLLITNDCGAMHLATALNVPMVAVLGPTARKIGFYPYNSKDIVVEKTLLCRPCGKHGHLRCPKKHFNCMKLITVAEVVEAAKKRLEV